MCFHWDFQLEKKLQEMSQKVVSAMWLWMIQSFFSYARVFFWNHCKQPTQQLEFHWWFWGENQRICTSVCPACAKLSQLGAVARNGCWQGSGCASWYALLPIGSMYSILTYIYHKHQPNVGKYTIHGSCGLYFQDVSHFFLTSCAVQSPWNSQKL